MDSEKLKKVLAGISIMVLIAGTAVTVGCGKPGGGDKKDTAEVSKDADSKKAEEKSGGGGK